MRGHLQIRIGKYINCEAVVVNSNFNFNFNSQNKSAVIAEAEKIHNFLQQTPELSATEQAELLGALVENTRRRSSGRGRSRGGGFNFGQLARGIQTGLSIFQTGTQIAGGLAGAFGGNSRTAQDFRLWANRLGQGAGQAGGLLQMLQGGGRGRSGARPVARAPTQRRAAPRRAPPQRGAPARGVPARGTPQRRVPQTRIPAQIGAIPGQMNNTALLGFLLNNLQIREAISAAPFYGAGNSYGIDVTMPNNETISIPLAAVLNSIEQLARAAIVELNASVSGGETETPEYLLRDDGEFIVDPANSGERANLVLDILRQSGEAQRQRELIELNIRNSAIQEQNEQEEDLHQWLQENENL